MDQSIISNNGNRYACSASPDFQKLEAIKVILRVYGIPLATYDNKKNGTPLDSDAVKRKYVILCDTMGIKNSEHYRWAGGQVQEKKVEIKVNKNKSFNLDNVSDVINVIDSGDDSEEKKETLFNEKLVNKKQEKPNKIKKAQHQCEKKCKKTDSKEKAYKILSDDITNQQRASLVVNTIFENIKKKEKNFLSPETTLEDMTKIIISEDKPTVAEKLANFLFAIFDAIRNRKLIMKITRSQPSFLYNKLNEKFGLKLKKQIVTLAKEINKSCNNVQKSKKLQKELTKLLTAIEKYSAKRYEDLKSGDDVKMSPYQERFQGDYKLLKFFCSMQENNSQNFEALLKAMLAIESPEMLKLLSKIASFGQGYDAILVLRNKAIQENDNKLLVQIVKIGMANEKLIPNLLSKNCSVNDDKKERKKIIKKEDQAKFLSRKIMLDVLLDLLKMGNNKYGLNPRLPENELKLVKDIIKQYKNPQKILLQLLFSIDDGTSEKIIDEIIKLYKEYGCDINNIKKMKVKYVLGSSKNKNNNKLAKDFDILSEALEGKEQESSIKDSIISIKKTIKRPEYKEKFEKNHNEKKITSLWG